MAPIHRTRLVTAERFQFSEPSNHTQGCKKNLILVIHADILGEYKKKKTSFPQALILPIDWSLTHRANFRGKRSRWGLHMRLYCALATRCRMLGGACVKQKSPCFDVIIIIIIIFFFSDILHLLYFVAIQTNTAKSFAYLKGRDSIK